VVLRSFVVVADRFAAGQHRGVDLAAPPGAIVRSACSGRVSFAGRVPRGGRTVSVRCGRLVATYQHLGEIAVARGTGVVAGARIGRAGRARPRPHVHLGARVRSSGAYVDPLTLFGAGPRRPLPPLPGARRPRSVPLGPAPGVRRPVPFAPPLPQATRPLPVAAPGTGEGGPQHLPWPVWVGLGSVSLGMPLGGLVRRRVRRRRDARATVAQVAS
jgi:murein DD-endopeptidase MepM/ murein hydrolase activator NlpD